MKKLLPLALIVLLLAIGLLYNSVQTVADGTYASIGTGDGADGSNDAINFSQGRVWTIDKYGKYIWLTQARGPTSHWAWSNNDGANWAQGSEGYTALTRGSIAYDSVNDVLHVIWAATDTNDGIIYRRYTITRDGSNNITDILRVDAGTVNLQLDTSASRALEQPVALWVNDGSAYGSLVAIWLKEGTGITEIRGSMRKLSMTAADGVGGNWQALDNTGDSFLTDPPAVAADMIYGIGSSDRVAASAIIRGGSGGRKDDLYVFVAAQNSSNILAYRAIWNAVGKDWRDGFQSPVTVGSMDVSAGYGLKEQLITKPVLDAANDRLYVGWARWKSGGDGDTVSITYLDSSDTASSTVDIYSANSTHSYAPSLDIAFDSTQELLYAAYIESTTNGDNGSINYKTYDGSTLSSPTRFYTSPGGVAGADGGADIPILYENRSTNDRMLFAFRVNGSLPPTGIDPHVINWGYVAIPTVTPTPTPTNTPSSSTSSSSSSSSGNSGGCGEGSPGGNPNLFQIDVSDTQATVYFVPVAAPVTHYTAVFGYASGDERFSTTVPQSGSSGAILYTLQSLSPGSTYVVKLRADNNCRPGGWGNEIKIVTAKKGAKKGIRYFKNFRPEQLSVLPQQLLNQQITFNNSPFCEYTVKSGDSLSRIANTNRKSGNTVNLIRQKNTGRYPSLLKNTILRKGWKLQIACT